MDVSFRKINKLSRKTDLSRRNQDLDGLPILEIHPQLTQPLLQLPPNGFPHFLMNLEDLIGSSPGLSGEIPRTWSGTGEVGSRLKEEGSRRGCRSEGRVGDEVLAGGFERSIEVLRNEAERHVSEVRPLEKSKRSRLDDEKWKRSRLTTFAFSMCLFVLSPRPAETPYPNVRALGRNERAEASRAEKASGIEERKGSQRRARKNERKSRASTREKS